MKDHKTVHVVAVSYTGNIREFFCRDSEDADRLETFWCKAHASVLRGVYTLKNWTRGKSSDDLRNP